MPTIARSRKSTSRKSTAPKTRVSSRSKAELAKTSGSIAGLIDQLHQLHASVQRNTGSIVTLFERLEALDARLEKFAPGAVEPPEPRMTLDVPDEGPVE